MDVQIGKCLASFHVFSARGAKLDANGWVNCLIGAHASSPHFERNPGERLGITSGYPAVTFREHGHALFGVR